MDLNIRKNRKGIGTVFGMIFFLLIVMIVFSSFVIVLNQNTGLEQTVVKTQQMDNDKAKEQLVMLSPSYIPNTQIFSCDINNAGAISAQVIRIWIEDQSKGTYGFLPITTNGALQPNDEKTYSGSINVPSADVNDQYRFWFVTARGNQFTIQPNAQIDINSALSGVIGDFLPDYNSVQYGKYSQIGSQYGVKDTDWNTGWIIPTGSDYSIIWRVTCLYNGKNPITLDQNTMLFFVPSEPRNPGGLALNPFMTYIVGENTNGNNYYINNYPAVGITVQPQHRVTFYFGSNDPGGTGGQDNLLFTKIGPSLMSVIMYGKYPSDYAQSFPLFAVVPEPYHFVFTITNPQTAGLPFSMTIKAVDSSGNTVTGYGGTANLIYSAGTITPSATGAFSNGIWTGSVDVTAAGSGVTIAATDGSNTGTSDPFTVNPGALSKFVFSTISSPQIAGTAISGVNIIAQDAYGNTVTSYVSSTTLTETGGGVGGNIVPSPVTFANGQWSGSLIVTKSSSGVTITANGGGQSGTSNSFTVNPGLLTHFAVTAVGGGNIGTQVAGTAYQIVVTAQDAGGNTITSYVGIPTLTSSSWSGPQSIGVFVSGTKTGSVTSTLAGLTTITATDGVTGTSNSFAVTHASSVDHIMVSLNPTSVGAGGAVVGTALAYDMYGNTWDVSVLASWSIPAGGDGGSWISNVYTSHTAGTFSVQASYSGKTATASLVVNPGALSKFVFGAISSPQVAGTAYQIVVTAQDAGGNTITSYVGIPTLTSSSWSGPQSIGVFVSGTKTGSVTSTLAGLTTITATDGVTGTSNSFAVTHASSVDHIMVSLNPTSVGAGGAVVGTALAYDMYGNTWDVSVLASWSIPAGGDGGSWISNVYTSHTAGTFSVQASYSGKTATASLVVNPGALSKFVFSTISSPQTAGTAISGVTITAQDSNGNTVTSYAGSTTLTETDDGAGGSITQSPLTFNNGFWTGLLTVTKSGSGVTITAAGGGQSGKSNSITVNSSSAASFVVSGFPSPQFTGVSGSVTVTAKDAFANTAAGYLGTVHFSSSDGSATLPSNYVFVSGDNGVHTFTNGVTLNTPGIQSITTTDTVTGTITGSQTGITVYRNLILNPSFETNNVWTPTSSGGGSAAIQDNSWKNTGTYSGKTDTSGGSTSATLTQSLSSTAISSIQNSVGSLSGYIHFGTQGNRGSDTVELIISASNGNNLIYYWGSNPPSDTATIKYINMGSIPAAGITVTLNQNLNSDWLSKYSGGGAMQINQIQLLSIGHSNGANHFGQYVNWDDLQLLSSA